jgi:YfiH family protein
MQIKKSGKVHYVESLLLAAPGISMHGFTTRHEGVSRPPYNSLNLGLTTLDSPHNVEGNRSLLTRAFGARYENLVTVTQVHGTDLLVLNEPNQDFSHFQKLECDGIITNQPGVMIGVCVADCVPVLLLDPKKRVVAALHAGWKGTAEGIVRKGVEAMVSFFDCQPDQILAAIGPAIGSCCYEVDSPVAEAFRNGGMQFDSFAQPSSPGKWKLDLVAANRNQLLRAGLEEGHVESSGFCVSCEKDLFFSYRRDNGETGRQMGFIMLHGKG